MELCRNPNAKGRKKSETGRADSFVWLFLDFGFSLAQAGDAVAVFPLTALFEHFEALKALKHIPFATEGGCRPQASML